MKLPIFGPQARSRSNREVNPEIYSVDFALTVNIGNLTRYNLLRPLVERDRQVRARWHPIRIWFADDCLRFLPGAVRVRLRPLVDSIRLYFARPSDAVVLHAEQTENIYPLLLRYIWRNSRTVIIRNQDWWDHDKLMGRKLGRLALSITDLNVPWSEHLAAKLRLSCPDLEPEKIVVLHPGINLQNWPLREPHEPQARFQVLFVAGDLVRKGVDALLAAFEEGLGETCDLHIATQSTFLNSVDGLEKRIRQMPAVQLYLDLNNQDPVLKQLYRDCDVFVLPTTYDLSPWVLLEALATGVPTVTTNVGGIPDIVIDGQTGLVVPARNPIALAAAVDRLRCSADLREDLTRRGRAHVEANFDAHVNTAALLGMIKEAVDAKRSGTSRRAMFP